MAKTYRKMKEEFLYKLELFYRNFGSDWSIEDFCAYMDASNKLVEANKVKII